MPQNPRIRADASVAGRLIEAAESLYGRHGLEGVSLRQISVAAGTGNNYAVQYHFEDAGGLVRAILKKRMPELEMRMAQHLARAKAADRLTGTRALVELLFTPLFEHVNSRGERACARFLLMLLSSPTGGQYLNTILEEIPISDHIFDLLKAANPDIPLAFLRERQRLATIMVLNSIFNRYPPYHHDEFDAALIDNALDMASAALSAPLAADVREMLQRTDPAKT